MKDWAELLITIVCSVFASSGFWAAVQAWKGKKDVKTQMILGLGHDRIIYLCKKYIDQGYILPDEFENLNDYLYAPYLSMGGNGSAKRLMEEVKKLPINPPEKSNRTSQNERKRS